MIGISFFEKGTGDMWTNEDLIRRSRGAKLALISLIFPYKKLTEFISVLMEAFQKDGRMI